MIAQASFRSGFSLHFAVFCIYVPTTSYTVFSRFAGPTRTEENKALIKPCAVQVLETHFEISLFELRVGSALFNGRFLCGFSYLVRGHKLGNWGDDRHTLRCYWAKGLVI
jgi:hypothetical protein